MSLFLEVKSLSVVTELVVCVSDSLIAGDHLEVLFSEDLQVTVQGLKETVNRCLEMLEVLVHKSEVQVQSSDVRVVFSSRHLENG